MGQASSHPRICAGSVHRKPSTVARKLTVKVRLRTGIARRLVRGEIRLTRPKYTATKGAVVNVAPKEAATMTARLR